MTLKTITLLYTCQLLAVCAHAQYSDSVHYYASFASSGSMNQTNNTRTYLLNNGLKLGIRKQKISLNATNTWIYGEQQKVLSNNDYNSTLDFDVYTRPHFFYWGLGNYTASYSLKVNSQYQAGAGAAYSVVDKKNTYLNLSDGILYESSYITLTDSMRDKYTAFRNSFRLVLRFSIKDLVKFSSTSFLQNSLSDQNDYIIKSNITLGFKLRKWLTLNTAYAYNRYNRTARENTLISYGLTIEKYF